MTADVQERPRPLRAADRAAHATLQVDVWRGTEDGRFQIFRVPRRENQTILDVVTEIQRKQDPTLAYRSACRVGMCGSLSMVFTGRPT